MTGVIGSHWEPSGAMNSVCLYEQQPLGATGSHWERLGATGSRLKRGSNLLKHSPWTHSVVSMDLPVSSGTHSGVSTYLRASAVIKYRSLDLRLELELELELDLGMEPEIAQVQEQQQEQELDQEHIARSRAEHKPVAEA